LAAPGKTVVLKGIGASALNPQEIMDGSDISEQLRVRAPAHPTEEPDVLGYVIDHIKPLECGGADDPSNMQWRTVAEGKAKG